MDETRARLLDAAGHEFAEKGFENATIRSICERASVNVAAVNYHFGDKERLYEAVLMVAHHSRPTFIADVAGMGADPREALHRFVNNFLEELVFHQATPWHQEVMLREIASPTKASAKMIRESFQPRFEALLAVVRRLAPDSDSRRAHAIGFSVIAQCLHYKLNRSTSERIIGAEAFGQLDRAFLVDHITRFTLAALGHGEPLTGSLPPASHAGSRPRGQE